MYDYLIVGAGFSGSVLAQQLASRKNASIMLIDKRDHIGGNAYDYYNSAGILVHKYGPHIFHTNSERIFKYLSEFTKWRYHEHRVRALVEGKLIPIPLTAESIKILYNATVPCEDLQQYLSAVAERKETINNAEDFLLDRYGRDIYEKLFRYYTRKQWGIEARLLDSSVVSRIPLSGGCDDRYFHDRFQVMPDKGYTKMFEAILNDSRISLLLNMDFNRIRDTISYKKLIFTGPIDEFYRYQFGRLPYRSLRFEHITIDRPRYQKYAVVNYPDNRPYTRITEFKYLTGQNHPMTTISLEYPCNTGDPYYPVPQRENDTIYRYYKGVADQEHSVYFAGRLGTYRYLNMDQVVGQAISLADKLCSG